MLTFLKASVYRNHEAFSLSGTKAIHLVEDLQFAIDFISDADLRKETKFDSTRYSFALKEVE